MPFHSIYKTLETSHLHFPFTHKIKTGTSHAPKHQTFLSYHLSLIHFPPPLLHCHKQALPEKASNHR